MRAKSKLYDEFRLSYYFQLIKRKIWLWLKLRCKQTCIQQGSSVCLLTSTLCKIKCVFPTGLKPYRILTDFYIFLKCTLLVGFCLAKCCQFKHINPLTRPMLSLLLWLPLCPETRASSHACIKHFKAPLGRRGRSGPAVTRWAPHKQLTFRSDPVIRQQYKKEPEAKVIRIK